jgi:hypothetical protein
MITAASTDDAFHDRAWWKQETRHVGTDWPSIINTHLNILRALVRSASSLGDF